MRPLRLIGVRVPSTEQDDILLAWARLNEWITRKSLAREIEIGYGLVGVGGDLRGYAATIEMPEAVTRAEADELASASLQGGAYLRSRFEGHVDEISGKLEGLRMDLNMHSNVRFDEERPLVCVFFDLSRFKSGTHVKSNLLIPVCRCEMPELEGHAA